MGTRADRRRVLVDVTPLRESREFRLLYGGEAVSYLGTQVTAVAAPIQVYGLTGSSLAVGLLGLAQLVPLILGSFLGGALADAHDRRKLLLVAQVLLAATSAGLALNAALPSPQLWPIYVLTALQAGFAGIDHPTRAACTPVLVRREVLASALALNQLMWQAGLVVGPLLAGALIATSGVGVAYIFDVVSFVAVIGTLLAMRPIRPEGGGTPAGRASIMEGFRYLKGRQALQGTFVIDLNAMIFGMPRALFPAIGLSVYGGDATTVGLLYAAPGAGALVAAITSGWFAGVDRQGLAVVLSVVVWGAAITVFGLTSVLPLALSMLALAGAADVVSAVFRNAVLQLTVPDSLRGRLSAIHIAVVTGGPRLGDVEAGAVAALTTPTFSVVTGGLACMAGAGIIARLMPALTGWRLREHGGVAPRPEPESGFDDESLFDDEAS